MKHSEQDLSTPNNRLILPGQGLFYFIAAVGILISLLMWYVLLLHADKQLVRVFPTPTTSSAKNFLFQPELRISALKPMAKGIPLEAASSSDSWEEDLMQFLTNYTGFELASIERQLSFIALVLGIFIALLVAIAHHLAQVAKQRAKSLDQINHDLKKEIAERLQAEETKQKLEKALLQGQKLQAIGTLAGGIAHDFNNLIYAIIGYTEMAQEDVPAGSLVHQNLGKVLEASQRAQELVSRILTFGRRQHHDFSPIQVKSMVENVLKLLEPTIPASVPIDLKTNIPDDFTILGNETQLHQVLVNLINNAVDAMDGEGHISLELSVLLAKDPLVRKQFPHLPQQNYGKIEVKDSGHGMDQATMDRIFEPFFTTKEVGKGTGLGLATVHAIMEEHKGEISVSSQLGHGATFTILLPEYSHLHGG